MFWLVSFSTYGKRSLKMKKKILYLRTDLCKDKLIAGGSVTHTLGVIEGLLYHGYEVIVASSVMIEQYESLGIACIKKLTIPKTLQWLKWKIKCLLSNFFFTYQSYKLTGQYSVQKIYQRYGILNCSGIILSMITGLPLILEYNGSEAWIDEKWGQKKFIKLSWLIRAIEWINIHYADCIVVVSKPLCEELISRGVKPERILINPNGVNTQRLNPETLKDARRIVRSQLNINDSFVFGFIGTFGQWHGTGVISAMVPQVLVQKPNAHFLLIGDGDLLQNLKDELKLYIDAKKVTCTGLLPSREAERYLAACDAFLSPTQPNGDGTPFFGSPTKLFAYLSMAKPTIASDLDQVAEVLSPAIKLEDLDNQNLLVTNELGILLDPKNEQAFVHAACSLMNLSNDSLEKLGNNARMKAIERYDWNIHVEKILMH